MKKTALYSKYQNFPLIVAIVYYISTVLLSILGPVKYFNEAYKYWLVLPFMAGVCLCFYSGYFVGKRTLSKTHSFYSNETIARREGVLLKRTLVVSILSLTIELGYLLSVGHFSFHLTDVGDLYNARIENGENAVFLVRFIFAAFRMMAIAIGIYRYKNAATRVRILIITNVVLYILVFLFGYGNQKGVSDIIIYSAAAIFVTRVRSNKRINRKTIIIILTMAIAALFLFSYMQYLRYEPRGINASNFHLYSSGEFYYDTNHVIFKLFGEKLGFGMASILSGYLSQGYYGLSLCLQLPFEWCYGAGSSYAFSQLLSKFGITGIYDRTYLSRMTESFGRNGLRSWNTIFPWLASDYTWVGAILFFALVGYLLARAWKEVIENDNIVSYLVVVNIMILVLFTPANNQLFHGYDSFVSTWFLIVFWLGFRGRYMHEQ